MAGEAIQLYDAATGAPITADAATAGDLVRSGKAGFLADQQVAIKDQTGATKMMSGADAATYLGSAEARFGGGGLGSAETVRQQQMQEQYGDLSGMALAGIAGGLRGATLGLSDAALVGAGLVRADTLQGLSEANRGSSLVGEAAGMIAPILLSGGAGGAARAAAGLGATEGAAVLRGAKMAAGLTPSALVSRGGMAIERAIAGGSPTALSRIGAGAASSAAEGALFGVGQEVSRATLRNEDLTAEKLVAAAGHGALLGGVTGGGLSAAGTLLRGAASKASDAGAGLLRRMEQREAGLAGELSAATPKAGSTVQALAGQAERQLAYEATGASARTLAEIQGAGKDVEARFLRQYFEDVPKALGKGASPQVRTIEEMAQGARQVADEAAAKVGTLASEIKTAGIKADTSALLASQRAQISEAVAARATPAAAKEAKKAEEWLTLIEKTAADDPAALVRVQRELRREIDATLAPGEHLGNDLKRNLSKAIDEELTAVGQRASQEMGPELAARWTNATAEMRSADLLSRATAEGAKAAGPGFGVASAAKAAFEALKYGNVLGAPVAVASEYLSHVASRHGLDFAAQLARGVRQGEVVSTVERAFDQLLGSRAASLAGVSKTALGALTGAAQASRAAAPLALSAGRAADTVRAQDAKKDYQSRAQALASYQAAPQQRVATATAGLPPATAQAVGSVVQRGADFLQSKLPKRPLPDGVPPQIAKASEPSPAEISKFLRYARAVDDPIQVLEDAQKGKLSPEAVEAVREVYPSVYKAIVDTVQEHLLARTKPLTWQEEMQFARLGIPTGPNTQPDAIRAFQAAYSITPPAQSSAPAPPKALSRPLNPPRLASRTDSLGAENV